METVENEKEINVKHWLFQILPPLSILCILFLTDNGTSLVFLAGIFIIPFLISIFSVIAKLIQFKKKKYFLVRPLLTIVFFFFIFVIAHWTYKVALKETISAAKIIHEECNQNLICPENPVGWNVDDSSVKRNKFGFWFKYTAIYSYQPKSFKIHIYRGPDTGVDINGGVEIPFNVTYYREDQY